jgi:hypothetical protein
VSEPGIGGEPFIVSPLPRYNAIDLMPMAETFKVLTLKRVAEFLKARKNTLRLLLNHNQASEFTVWHDCGLNWTQAIKTASRGNQQTLRAADKSPSIREACPLALLNAAISNYSNSVEYPRGIPIPRTPAVDSNAQYSATRYGFLHK